MNIEIFDTDKNDACKRSPQSKEHALKVVTPANQVPELPKERDYTPTLLECWRQIGFYAFDMPVETYPWSGRSQHAARRIVFSKYIEPEDVLSAVWVEERAKRDDPDWRLKEPGMSYISALMRERSGNRWMEEMADLVAKLPTLIAYMDKEWGEETRAVLAHERRSNMQVVN
jgi:hypothetical protein